jgi:HEAT repeat protein
MPSYWSAKSMVLGVMVLLAGPRWASGQSSDASKEIAPFVKILENGGLDAEMAEKVHRGHGKLPDDLPDENERARTCVRACVRLKLFGSKAKEAIPTLIKTLAYPDTYYGHLVREQAAEALANMGPDVVPVLVVALTNRSDDICAGAAEALGRLGPKAKAAIPDLIYALNNRDAVRETVFAALARVGPKDKAPIPDLIYALDREDSPRAKAIEALARVGPDAVPLLIEALSADYGEDDEFTNRSYSSGAAAALGKMGTRARAAIPALIKALQDQPEGLRRRAAEALGEMGPEAKTAVPALIQTLQNQEDRAREEAVEALGKIGPEAAPAVPALVKLLKTKKAFVEEGSSEEERKKRQWWHDDVRAKAATALGRIGAEAKAAVPALVDALKEERNDIGGQAAEALGRFGPDAKEAMPALLRRWPGYVPAEAVWRIDGQLQMVVPAILQALELPNVDVQEEGKKLLTAIGPRAVPAITKALTSGSTNQRCKFAQALGRLGPDLSFAAPALLEAMKDKEDYVRRDAVEALKKIVPEGNQATISALIQALKDKEAMVRSEAAAALGRIGPQAQRAVPALTLALKDKDELVRDEAAQALGFVGPAAKPALAALVEVIEEAKGKARLTAICAVAKIDGEHPGGMPTLIAALDDKKIEPEVRKLALNALIQIGPAARSAVPALIRVLKEPDTPDTYESSVMALGRIGSDKAARDALRTIMEGDQNLGFLAAAYLLRLDHRDDTARMTLTMDLPTIVRDLAPNSRLEEFENRLVLLDFLDALTILGADAQPAIPLLHWMARTFPYPEIREAAAKARERIRVAHSLSK